MELKLGVKAKDVVTGFTGIVTSITTYLTGCDRVVITPEVSQKDGGQSLTESGAFDINSVTVIDNGVSDHFKEKVTTKTKTETETKKGGPEVYKSKNVY